MKNAKELLLTYLDGFSDPKKAANLFATDGVLELPYLAELGFPWRYVGQDAIEGLLQFALELYPGAAFENIKVLIETPDQVFGEYEINVVSGKTGRFVQQLFFGRLVAEGGKITLLREALNIIATVYALYPDGLANVPPFRDGSLQEPAIEQGSSTTHPLEQS